MSHLGSFGAAAKEITGERDTFDFFGEEFQVVGTIPPMLMIQLGAAATGKIDEQEGLGAMWETMRICLTTPEHQVPNGDGTTKTVPADEEQFTRFYRLAVARCCELEELLKLANALFEAQAGRPTEEPQGSSPGPTTTSPSSNGSSSTHPALAGMTPVADLVHGSPGHRAANSAT